MDEALGMGGGVLYGDIHLHIMKTQKFYLTHGGTNNIMTFLKHYIP